MCYLRRNKKIDAGNDHPARLLAMARTESYIPVE